MQAWTDGYVTEIGYTHAFHGELQPWPMAAALGAESPIRAGTPFDYCELGFGQGFTLALLAAANPQARFWGNDINPAHVTHARDLAAAAQLGNLTVSDLGFAEYGRTDLPLFDIIALHGVWSWVGPAQRTEILEFIQTRLKPSGLVYLGYNVLPGWAQYLPLRELMLATARRTAGDLPSRIEASITLADRLRAGGAAHFAINPTLSPRLDLLAAKSSAYLAHEYFNENWHPTYFTDLAAALAPVGLTFAAQARAADRMEAAVQDATILTVGGNIAATDRDFAEMMRDFLSNRPFRRDLFRRGTVVTNPPHWPLWVATGHPRDLPRRATLPGGTPLDIPYDTAHALLTRLGEGPGMVDDGPALQCLAALGLVVPALPREGLETRRLACDRLNEVIINAASGADRLSALASPVTGGAVDADRIELLFLAARWEGRAPVDFAWSVLDAAGQTLLRDGKPLIGADRNRAELTDRWERFARRRLPLLTLLGAVR